MNEVAWCYLEGFGCKKDKVRFFGTIRNCVCPMISPKIYRKETGMEIMASVSSFLASDMRVECRFAQ
jgi:hypothetical protein